MTPTLKMDKLRPREVNQLAQGHSAIRVEGGPRTLEVISTLGAEFGGFELGPGDSAPSTRAGGLSWVGLPKAEFMSSSWKAELACPGARHFQELSPSGWLGLGLGLGQWEVRPKGRGSPEHLRTPRSAQRVLGSPGQC